MEQLEEELTCPVCCGLFEDPRVLLCSHTFCRKCLEGLLEGGRAPAFRTPLKCPTCRKETPHNGAGSLQVNYSLRGIVEKFSRIEVPPRMSACTQHRGQPLNIFCATDSRLICGFCATTDGHAGHAFASLEEACAREKEAFRELLRAAEGWPSADTLSRLETLRAGRKAALRSVGRDAQEVADYFDRLVGALECKKSEILADFDALKLAAMQAHDPEIARLSAALEERGRALAAAESVGSAGSEPLRFLEQMQEFRERLGFLRETPPPPQPPPSRGGADAGSLVRDFDVRKWDSLRLWEIDKIAVPHESGSYSTRPPRTAWIRRVTASLLLLLLPALMLLMLMLLMLLMLMMLPPDGLDAAAAALTSKVHPCLTGLVSRAHACLQDTASLCSGWMDAGQACVVKLTDSAVHFICSCLNSPV